MYIERKMICHERIIYSVIVDWHDLQSLVRFTENEIKKSECGPVVCVCKFVCLLIRGTSHQWLTLNRLAYRFWRIGSSTLGTWQSNIHHKYMNPCEKYVRWHETDSWLGDHWMRIWKVFCLYTGRMRKALLFTAYCTYLEISCAIYETYFDKLYK